MSGLEFTISLLKIILSWPVLVGFALWLLREPLKELIEDIESASLPGSSSIKRRLREARRTVEQAREELEEPDTRPLEVSDQDESPPTETSGENERTDKSLPPITHTEPHPPPSDSAQWALNWLTIKPLSNLSSLASSSPHASINETWRYVRNALREAVGPWGPYANAQTFAARINSLANRGILPPSWLDGYNRLRLIRNTAAHSNNRITAKEALNYVDVAQSLLESLPIDQVRAYEWKRGRPRREADRD